MKQLTLPETNSKFAPESLDGLEYFRVSFWGPLGAYFQGLRFAVSFRECIQGSDLSSELHPHFYEGGWLEDAFFLFKWVMFRWFSPVLSFFRGFDVIFVKINENIDEMLDKS